MCSGALVRRFICLSLSSFFVSVTGYHRLFYAADAVLFVRTYIYTYSWYLYVYEDRLTISARTLLLYAN